MSCDNGITIKKYILSGETGADGAKGDPGEATQLPIDATDVNVTNDGFTTVQDALDHLLLAPMVINNFSAATLLFENRLSTHASADFDILWVWEVSKDIVAPGLQTLVGPVEMTPVVLVNTDRSKLVSLENFNTTSNFTLTVTDEVGNVTAAVVPVVFTNNVYWGDKAIPGAIDSAFILALNDGDSPSLQTTNVIDVYSTTDPSAVTPNEEYFWFATEANRPAPTFKVGGFPFDMQLPTLVSFTNNFGHTVNYNVYRSTNHSLSTIFVNIT